jgi:8-oxo-dGTP diphosphatase
MAIYLVRHAKAGDREDWEGDDRLRPLTKSGWRQAEGLLELLGDRKITRVLSSPYLRCTQTVEPLAKKLGLRIEKADGLAEGAGLAPTLTLLKDLAGEEAVLCTHGDIMQDMVEDLARQRIITRKEASQIEKGATWVLDVRNGKIVAARHLPPPA